MNRWLLIHRLRWPAFLVLFGITALLNQWDVLSFGRSWPLYLILAGVFLLAERAALSGAPPLPQPNLSSTQSYASPGTIPVRYSEPGAPPPPTPPSIIDEPGRRDDRPAGGSGRIG